MMTPARRRRMFVTASATAASALICAFVHVTAIATVGAIPLILFLPGFALVIAVDPHDTMLSGSQRVYWSAATSIALAVLGGLILNETTGLDRNSWIILLTWFVLLCLGVSWSRNRDHHPRLTDNEHLWLPAWGPNSANLGTFSTPGPDAKRIYQMPISLRSAMLLFAALGLVLGAIAMSQSSQTASNPKFIELWMVPSPLAAGASAQGAKLGVQNLAGTDIDIVVRLYEGRRRLVSEWPVKLAAGSIWSRFVERQGTQSLVATVTYTSDPTRVVRYVDLTSPVT
jgi:hypothetical protein